MRTIFILMDSLNRHYLNCYGESWVKTPNIDRFAQKGVVFNNHWAGSLPCMPARRDLMTGRITFLETPWSPIMPWDETLPDILREQKGVYSHMITDHYHYFHEAGDGYHNLFDSWEFERGQEGDVWRPVVELPEIASGRGKAVAREAYWRNRKYMDTEDDLSYSTPRTFNRGIEFLEQNSETDNWHLHLELFDPHEPFDCPKKYTDLYEDDWDRKFFTWPPYAKLDPEYDDEKTVNHIRKCYAGTLTMADNWLGKFMDKMSELDMWKDTTVILTTDHGHLLGEYGYWAKNYMHDYAKLANIPLFISTPECHTAPEEVNKSVNALTWAPDLMPTLLDLHDVEIPKKLHGKSIKGLLTEDKKHHDSVIYGYFGKDVNWTDGNHTYCCQPLENSTIYNHTLAFFKRNRDALKNAEFGVFLKECNNVPQIRIKGKSHRHHDAPDFNPIFDLKNDPEQLSPIQDSDMESQFSAKLKQRLIDCDAPDCQYERLSL